MADRNENRLVNEAGVKAPANIKYHAGFVSGLELLLWKYREQVEIEPEKWLSTEGIRMDVLILKKDPSLVLDFDIGRIFRGHILWEGSWIRKNTQCSGCSHREQAMMISESLRI